MGAANRPFALCLREPHAPSPYLKHTPALVVVIKCLSLILFRGALGVRVQALIFRFTHRSVLVLMQG